MYVPRNPERIYKHSLQIHGQVEEVRHALEF